MAECHCTRLGVITEGQPSVRRGAFQQRTALIRFNCIYVPPGFCRMIGMKACGDSQHWTRELTKLGHKVRLLQARFVKAFVMSNKNDVMSSRAIWIAVQQPGKEIAVKYRRIAVGTYTARADNR